MSRHRRKDNRLLFLSRHSPSFGQISMAKTLGFDGIKREKVIFPDTKAELEKVIDKLMLVGKITALTAPTWVHYVFWEKGITTIEFVKNTECKVNFDLYRLHIVRGAWIFKPNSEGSVSAKFKECESSFDEQLKFAGIRG